MQAVIYKVLTRQQWQAFQASGKFAGAPIDRADGFMHFSAAEQVLETVAKHFPERDGLMIIEVDARHFGDELKWEASRGGQLFPHLYSALEIAHIHASVPFDQWSPSIDHEPPE